MKLAVLVASISLSASFATAQQRPAPASTPAASDKVADAYAQFLLGHHLDETDQEDAAVAAYKLALELDPMAADIPAELAGLYLRLNKVQEATTTAEQALKIAPANREANRVLGTIDAALSESASDSGRGSRASGSADENLAKAIHHFELAMAGAAAETDPNVRATLSDRFQRPLRPSPARSGESP